MHDSAERFCVFCLCCCCILQMHNDAERFDPRTEQVFKILQVISACAMSFAHGSNDIANSIGSFSAAYYVYQNMKVPGSNAEVRWDV
jgi:sodium-dependent phosphate transporter